MTARARLWLDLALFGALFVGYNPAWTGIAVHEWLCLIAVVPLLFHVIINWDQTLRILNRFAEIVRATPKVNLVVDAALFVAAVTVMLSGLLISQYVAKAVGVTILPTSLWVTTHRWSADATMLLLLVHFALHWRWVVKTGRQARAPAPERRRRRPDPGHPPGHAASRDAAARGAVRHRARDHRRPLSTLTSPRRRTMKLMRNTTAVLVLTLFTGLAVFTAIQLGGRLFGTPTASAQDGDHAVGRRAVREHERRRKQPELERQHPVRPERLRQLQRLREFERRPDVHVPGHRLHGVDLSRHAVT